MKKPLCTAGAILLICIGAVAALTACSFIYKKPAAAVDRVLAALQLQRHDLGMSRPLPQNDPFLLNKVGLFLRSPLQIHSFAQTIENSLGTKPCDLSSLIALAATIMEIKIERGVEAAPAARLPAIESLPAPLNQAAGIIYQALPHARALFEEAFKTLNAEEKLFVRKQLQEFLLPEAMQKKLSRRQDQDLTERTFALAARVDRGKMLAAAAELAAAVDRSVKILREENSSHLLGLVKKEIVTISTPLGDIVIGGPGNNRYTGGMPLLLIDIGGDDQYAFTSYNPLSIIIDVSGNDIYDATDGAPLAAGILGMGFLIDMSGNDTYTGQNLSFGCGLLGVGVLLDESGNDVYRGQAFTQGAAALGLGIVCDAVGNDDYQGSMYSQGFGFVGGCGLMIDYRGNDRLICSGGAQDFREKSGAFQSCSQGYGLGCRGFAAGGAGILYNGEGDDIYEGSYFCQGSSYWLAIGMLIDAKGNDRFQARRYSQGSGVHSSIGALVDREGDDVYASWGVSQGCGHDRSVGMLWDSRGNDRYTAEWLSQGSGNDAGIGLLVDEQGDDTYTAGADGPQGSGKYDERRDELSIGILVDAGGKDFFTGLGKDKKIWTQGRMGGGIDGDGSLPAIWREPFEKAQRQPAFAQGYGGRAGTEAEGKSGIRGKTPALSTQHAARSAQRESAIVPELEALLLTEESWQKAADALAGRAPAIIPALLEYMDIKDVVVQRTLEETFRKIGWKNARDLNDMVTKKNLDRPKKTFLLYVLGDIADPQSRDLFLILLQDQDSAVQAMALRGLYKLKASPPLQVAQQLAKSRNADVRKYLALSLCSADDKAAAALLKKLRLDNDFNVRYAAGKRMK